MSVEQIPNETISAESEANSRPLYPEWVTELIQQRLDAAIVRFKKAALYDPISDEKPVKRRPK
jgi:hypothetical protein